MNLNPMIGLLMAAAVTVSSGLELPDRSAAVWRPCAQPDLPAELECSTISVPVDWSDPVGRTITLDMARAPTVGANRAGSVVMNPGGPGNSGIQALGAQLSKFAGLRKQMDVVTWNPRGTDGTVLPYEKCRGGPSLMAFPADRAEYDAAAEAGHLAMQPCRDVDPVLFDHMDSATQARDMEAIRAALGDGDLNYFGNSYGGVLGESYARLFPDRVRTMFLDSIVDHVSPVRDYGFGQYRAAEELFDRFVAWCREAPECLQHGADLSQVWLDLLADADRKPIPMVGANPPIQVDADGLKFLAMGLLIVTEWPEFSKAIASAQRGDAASFDWTGQLVVPHFAAIGVATQCADGFRFDDFDDFAAARAQAATMSPHFAGEREYYASLCAAWRIPVANPSGPLPGDRLPPFLGAAPIVELAAVRAAVDQVPGSSLIRFDDVGHGLYLNEGNRCVVEKADRYLIDGVLPPSDTVCPPNES
ncbi:alpha/beta fold hydrolase [Pseudonocardia sp. TRM90224]|uniref:alpha/beta fold hydrolase n=1 Tax=Pseudonocardia sp. TRM90224 TaxID=2812678 RepID=UPI001E60B6C3|nr:alpha/beta fold hydrolase [Pseudonocardia sp. TRM90224]